MSFPDLGNKARGLNTQFNIENQIQQNPFVGGLYGGDATGDLFPLLTKLLLGSGGKVSLPQRPLNLPPSLGDMPF